MCYQFVILTRKQQQWRRSVVRAPMYSPREALGKTERLSNDCPCDSQDVAVPRATSSA